MINRFVRAFALACLSGLAVAQDLGSYGQSYSIQEPDMLETIKARAQAMVDSGAYARYRQEAIDQVKRRFNEPAPVDHLRPATAPRTFYYDPTIVVYDDIRAPDGNVIVPAGTRVNPLDHVPFQGKWVFVDGREPAQLEWARAQLTDATVRPIFIAGRWMDAWRQWAHRTYFDQGGALVRRLGIVATPAIVTQDGPRIRIDEIAL